MGGDQAEGRGHFKEGDDGQAAAKHEEHERPFGDVPADVGVEVVAAQAGIDGPDFHGVAEEELEAARHGAIDADQHVGEAEKRDDGHDGIRTPRARGQGFSPARFCREEVGPGKSGQDIEGEKEHDVSVDGGAEAADEARIDGRQKGGEGAGEGESAVRQAEGERGEGKRQERDQTVRSQQRILGGRGKKSEQADGLEHFTGHFGQTPERIEEQFDDPEQDDAQPGEAEQPWTGLIMDQFQRSDEMS
jgi:hypothetical protein